MILKISPSIHKFDDVLIYSGLSAALGYEPFGLELMAERLGPNGVTLSALSSRSKTIAVIMAIKIRYSVWESKHLVSGLSFNINEL